MNERIISKPKISRLLFYKVIIIICWLISIYFVVAAPDNMNTTFMTYILINTIVSSFFFLSYQKVFFNSLNLLSISFLFVFSYFISHFQIALLHVFGYKIDSNYFEFLVWANSKTGNLALSISSLGLTSFYLGYSFRKFVKIIKNNTFRNQNFKSIIKLSIILSYIFYFLFFITSGSYKYGNYSAGDNYIISNYFFAIFNVFISVAIILKTYNLNAKIIDYVSIKTYINFIGKPLTVIIFWHILFSIYVGDRGPVIVLSILYFGLYIIRVFNKKHKLILIFSLLLVPVLLSVLGASRGRANSNSFISRVSSSNYESRYSHNFSQQNLPWVSTLELALSARCINHCVANVPEKYDYRYGAYQFQQIVAAIPFLSGFLKENVLKYKDEEDSSADFISYLIQGDNPTYGDGTTPDSDLYLDFGWIGVAFGFFFFGIFAHRADYILFYRKETSLFHWIAIMLFLSGAVYLGRATFLFYFQRIFQIYIVIIFLNSFIKRR